MNEKAEDSLSNNQLTNHHGFHLGDTQHAQDGGYRGYHSPRISMESPAYSHQSTGVSSCLNVTPNPSPALSPNPSLSPNSIPNLSPNLSPQSSLSPSFGPMGSRRSSTEGDDRSSLSVLHTTHAHIPHHSLNMYPSNGRVLGTHQGDAYPDPKIQVTSNFSRHQESISSIIEVNTELTSSESFQPPSLQVTSEDNQTISTDQNDVKDGSSFLGDGRRDSKDDHDSVPLSFLKFEDVEPYFDLRLEDACERLGISTTSMKKICRQWYIQRWPFRKLKSLQTKLDKIKKQLKEDSEEDPERKLSLYVRLRLEEQLKSVSDEILQIRSKSTYEDRRRRDSHHGRSFDSSSSSSHSPQFRPHHSPHVSPHLHPQLSPHLLPQHSPHLLTTQVTQHSPHLHPQHPIQYHSQHSQGSSPIHGPSFSPHQPYPYLSPYAHPAGGYSVQHHSPYNAGPHLHSSSVISPNLSSQMSHLNLAPFQLNPDYPSVPRPDSLPAFGSQQQYQPSYHEEQSNSRGIFSDLRKVQSHRTNLSENPLPSFSSLMQSIEGRHGL